MRAIFFAIICFVTITGCLDFGDDVVTEQPTAEQLAFCEAVMHLNDQLIYESIGLRILGSGIDDAVWFCFLTEETDIGEIFDPVFVSPDSLNDVVSLYSPENMPDWWDADEKELNGGVFSLTGGRYMTVGIDPEENATTVYIFWHET